MIAYVFGGNASGKSAIAESLLAAMPLPRVYIATMQAYDDDARRRVLKHRRQRAGLGARTVERADLSLADGIGSDVSVLLDCTANLVANALWGRMAEGGADARPTGSRAELTRSMIEALEQLFCTAGNCVVVGNDVFGGDVPRTSEMELYLNALADVQDHVRERADLVVEAVCGIPFVHKGELPVDPMERT